MVGIFVVAGIIGALTGSGDNTAQQSTPATEPRPEPTAGKPATTARGDDLREPKRDGQFEFTVQSVKCGRRTVGSSGLTQTAQGQYCLVAVKVANVGDEARTFDSSSQYLFDSRGRKFETDDATLYLEDNGNAFLENINPGNSVNGTLVYDVPAPGLKRRSSNSTIPRSPVASTWRYDERRTHPTGTREVTRWRRNHLSRPRIGDRCSTRSNGDRRHHHSRQSSRSIGNGGSSWAPSSPLRWSLARLPTVANSPPPQRPRGQRSSIKAKRRAGQSLRSHKLTPRRSLHVTTSAMSLMIFPVES